MASLSRAFWIPAVAHSLVCEREIRVVDAILVEDFDQDYLVFERAAALAKAGVSPLVFVTAGTTADGKVSIVESGLVELMSRVALLENPAVIPIREVEPISLNAALQIRDVLVAKNIKSVLVVTPGFRSRRSSLVYQAVLGRAAITVICVPVFGTKTPETWASSWHGVQEVAEQFLKLQYYRFYVLPVSAWKQPRHPQG
jgi:hypothetical protein